uniref:Uncharacterized protein n=1 Tax=Chloropicon roscoffensis TaxID=1461544 RepID=A0A7S3C641_9CHLO|eukprot:CAMPEP_0198475040 /NCGR_PEP_ID=MMETSP1456-20131121/40611_1 /TAXON_ID=1461544 ORGANISM="Unidentified sp., Strain RCC1871" /NCGR_SAMPLE_ID=MMETSP1456 /ASSEMBLY_ACC=CAM_ASM_001119 /LENGTH=227 /DNA_ID=CAMNT_0044201737 /DNA_START=836 /DNA_END=1519 /DNA_ORIENTATION=-
MEAKLTKYERVPEEEIVEKPAPVHEQQQHEEFSTNLCDCCLDYETCCTGCCCPALLHAQNSTRLEGQEKFLPACCAWGWALCGSYYLSIFGIPFGLPCGLLNFVPWVTSKNRRKLRQAYNLKPRNACYDFCAHYWCMSCALCQEARELKIRGATPERPVYNTGARARILQRPGIQHLYPGFPVRDQAVELLAPAQVVAPAQATMDLEQPANGIPAPQFADPEKPWKK